MCLQRLGLVHVNSRVVDRLDIHNLNRSDQKR